MSREPGKKSTRRIAVALDASEHSLHVLGLAAGIAAALEAELEGVFVEDADLLRLAGLPFMREFRLATLGEEAVDAERLQRELRATARRVRETLEDSARRLGVTCSFRVWRGDLQAEILSAALDAEMFTLSRIGRFAPLRRQAGPSHPPRPAGELVVDVLFDGGDGATRALAAAAELAAGHKAGLSVILQASTDEEIEKLRGQAVAQLGAKGETTRFMTLPDSHAQALADAVAQTGGDVVVIDVGNSVLDQRNPWQSLGALDCPVIIIR
jgi:hypothetical protein